MSVSHRPVTPVAIAGDVLLGVVFVAGIAFTAYALADSWGGNSWALTSIVAVLVSLLALARRAHRAGTALVGMFIALAAIPISQVGDLPNEPAPITALALSVLVGSAVRTLPPLRAAGAAALGLVVVIAAWIADGFTAIAVFNTLGWLAAIMIGSMMRLADTLSRGSRRSSPYGQDPTLFDPERTRAW